MKKSVHTSEYAALRRGLREAREGAGLSQRGLAARLKVPHSWVAKVETGERRLDVLEFIEFVRACGGDAERLFNFVARQVNPRPVTAAQKRGR
jgi:transcriptional regulator with XRE-family HTH domain